MSFIPPYFSSKYIKHVKSKIDNRNRLNTPIKFPSQDIKTGLIRNDSLIRIKNVK
jgi:hypothetical protein